MKRKYRDSVRECTLCRSCIFYARCRLNNTLVYCRYKKCRPLCFSCRYYEEKEESE